MTSIDRRLRAVALHERGGEVDRASYQMVNHGISVMFFHFIHEGTSTFQMESMNGKVLVTKYDARGRFGLWIARELKTYLKEVENQDELR